MPAFGKISRTRLDTCHPDLQLLFSVVVKEFDCSVICGYRDQVSQTIAFNDEKSKVQYPDSKHNSYPSMAADVAPYPIDWEDLRRFDLFAGWVKGVAAVLHDQGKMEHRVRWGGDWNRDTQVKDNKFNDLVHFELVKA